MRRSFGKPTDLSARVQVNSELLTVRIHAKDYKWAVQSLSKAISKLPTPAKVIVGKGQELIN